MAMVMARYRAAAFFGRQFAPELLLGLPIEDEVRDIIDIDATGRHEVAVDVGAAFDAATEVRDAPEDMPTQEATPQPEPEAAATQRRGKPETAAPAATATGDAPLVTEGQQKVIQTSLDRKRLSAADLCMALNVDAVPMIPRARVNEALAWIEKATPGE